jgi:N-acetyl-gamma-glutamyl-phosphate reductase
MTDTGESPLKAGIVGGTGYAGVELLRLLVAHPQVELTCITSRGEEGRPVAELFPNLRGYLDLEFTAPSTERLAECDVVFFATPHNVAMRSAPELLAAGTRIIDISADFRLRDAELWSRWYGEPHACPELLAEAVYGLPEFNRANIAGARLVGCPGCYPTAIELGFLPLLESDRVDTERLIASAASGASGAGKSARVPMLLAEAGESFKAYGAGGHRHLPEIEQGLSDIAGRPARATFVPHLIPMVRGIHASLYATLRNPDEDAGTLQALFERRFADEPFVDVMPAGSHPETRWVKGANHCRLAVHRPPGGDTVVVLSVIDNLVKGASGQAIQNMNIMFGLPETQGLEQPGLSP